MTAVAATSFVGTERGFLNFAHATWVLGGRTVRTTFSAGRLFLIALAPLTFFVALQAVFAKLMAAQGVDYAQFLPPAIVVQTTMITAMWTVMVVGEQRMSGLMDRLRTMPINHGAVPASILVAAAVRAAVQIGVTVAASYLVGFRFLGGIAEAIAFVLLAAAFAVALSAGTIAVGLNVTDHGSVANTLFVPYILLLMLSTLFVPATLFPGWLQPVVELSPVSAVVEALRSLAGPEQAAVPILFAVAWIVVLGTVFGTAARRAFRRSE